MDYLSLKQWSPYIVGLLIGLLNIVSLLLSKKPLGASTGFLKIGGIFLRVFGKKEIELNEYYKKNTPKVDWGVMLVIGVVLGAFLSSKLSGDFSIRALPSMWSREVSSSFPLRFIASTIGGIFLGIGARWAGDVPVAMALVEPACSRLLAGSQPFPFLLAESFQPF